MTSVVSFAFSVVGQVCRVMEKDAERFEKLYGGLRFIQQEMEIVNALIKDTEYRGAVQEIRIRQLQELAYDFEDFVEGLWKPGAYGKVLVAIGTDPRPPQIIRIEHFEKTINSLTKEWKQSAESSKGEHTDHDAATSGLNGDEEEYLEGEEDLEIINGPKTKILELLSPSRGEGQQLRVISIVGCRGVGKTALARAVYNDRHEQSTSIQKPSDAFDCVAWVRASGCNNKRDLLNKILQRLREDLASRQPENVPVEAEGVLAMSLHDILSKKRCLVFIDDVQQAQLWKDTVDACPKNGSESRIIVTTPVRSVATACSFGSYVYSMQCLGDDFSKKLFWRKVYGCQKNPQHSLVTNSLSIFQKCDGLPLALTCTAKYLNIKGNCLEGCHCEEVGKKLGSRYLSDNSAEGTFKEMRRVLMQCYDNLPDYDHRSFLLYLSIFPRGHQIKSKSLVRRLKAEGLVVNEEPRKCFDELIDRCIIEPVQTYHNSVADKRCQVHGVVLEYIIQKSKTKNVVTLVQGQEPQGHEPRSNPVSSVRRLSVQSSTKDRFDDLPCKSALRSLTMFKSEPSGLQRYKMLRLLDLEGCTGVDNRFLEGLCELQLLRYLSLRNTGINKLPTNIEKLQCLETLDIRDTKVENLPMEVIMLPKLAYLFGKFQLPDKVTSLKKKSLLHTLSGFVVANRPQDLEHVHVLLRLARNLKKVKVWYNYTHRSLPVPQQSSSRKWCSTSSSRTAENPNFIRLLTTSKTLESVSIVSSELCKIFLASLEGSCSISSIKLRGNLDRLPDSNKLSQLSRIKKLQLFSTGLTIKDLSALQYLRDLEYLKLVEHYADRFCNGSFIVEKNGFESLKSLYIDAPEVPTLQFKQGAMQSLTSLHLLYRCNQKPSETVVEGISHLTNLSELILHSFMHEDWEKIADEHPNRPCVKRQPE